MTLEVETVVAVSVMMAVFSAVAAVGTSIVLGAGFERLRAGFDVVRKQTGFFSDAIYRLEQKVSQVDQQSGHVTRVIDTMEGKVREVSHQASAFGESIQKLEKKVDLVDRQASFFGDALHRLEQKIEQVDVLQDRSSAVQTVTHAEGGSIGLSRREALVCDEKSLLGSGMGSAQKSAVGKVSEGLTSLVFSSFRDDHTVGDNVRFH